MSEEKLPTIQDVVALAEKQLRLESAIDMLTKQLAQTEEGLKHVSQVLLPNMMAEIGLESMTLPGGFKVKIADVVYAKLPADTYNAFKWLRDNNMAGIIKTKLILDFGTGEEEQLKEVQELLTNAGMNPVVKSDIHHMTLKATVKEQLAKGTGIPLEDFGAGTIRTTVITN